MNKGKRILLIDDEEVITFGFSRVLASPEVTVDIAHTVKDSEELMATNDYSAAIIDLRLSKSAAMEGLSLIATMKAEQKNCKLIILTAYGEEGIKQQALTAGADLFFEKPVEPGRIREILRSFGIY
jgi:DNA-binding response OmpR family regulator